MASEKVRHPPGLYVLFGTEAAERFSFYTMRAILVLYLTNIIFVDAFQASNDYRGDLQKEFETSAHDVYGDAMMGLEKALLDQHSELFLKRGGVTLQYGENLKSQEAQLKEILAVAYSDDELEKQQGSLTGLIKKATSGVALEEYKRDLDSQIAGAFAVQYIKTQQQVFKGTFEKILDRGFANQELKGEQASALFGSGIQTLSGDGEGYFEWVVTRKVKRDIRTKALAIYGLYLLLVYLSGLIGGYLADKVLGSRKAILMGGIVMGAGLFTMWWPELVFYGLGLIIAGNAFFKPNISTIVSGLYPENDKRRDPAFTIFYMGINLGAFIAIFGAGYAESLAAENDWGWNVGFVLAGVGMLFSLALFQWGQRYLGTAGFPPNRVVDEKSKLIASDYRDVAIWAVGVSVVAVLVILAWNVVGPIWEGLPTIVKFLIGVGIIAGAAFGMRQRGKKSNENSEPLTKEELQRVVVIMVLSVFVIFFWAGFEQAGGTMNLFAYEQTDRHIFGWEMPATWFQGFNPIFIIILAPLFSMLWTWNDKQSFGLSTPGKMGVGMIVLGLGFVVMYFGALEADRAGKAGLVWLAAVYLIHTVGELCLSPIGLSMVTKLSPVRIVSLMMGVWFACTAVADYMSGRLEEIVHHYGFNLWAFLFIMPIGAGFVLLALTPLLKRWMHGRA